MKTPEEGYALGWADAIYAYESKQKKQISTVDDLMAMADDYARAVADSPHMPTPLERARAGVRIEASRDALRAALEETLAETDRAAYFRGRHDEVSLQAGIRQDAEAASKASYDASFTVASREELAKLSDKAVAAAFRDIAGRRYDQASATLFRAHVIEKARADSGRSEPEQAAEPVAWREHVEQRLLTWRQRRINRNGDQLALDDFMDNESLDDMIDFVCSEYASPPKREPLTDAQINEVMESCLNDWDWRAFARAIERAHGICDE